MNANHMDISQHLHRSARSDREDGLCDGGGDVHAETAVGAGSLWANGRRGNLGEPEQ